MRLRQWGAVLALGATLGALGIGPANAARGVPLQHESRVNLSFIPVHAGEDLWRPLLVAKAAGLAASWLAQASGGRVLLGDVDILPPLSVPTTTCRDLAYAVATQQVVRAREPHRHWVYLGDARDCPYTGLAETPGTWIVIPSASVGVPAIARTLVHELGHNLGLGHAGAETCPVLRTTMRPARDCGLEEYGDPTDPLGSGTLRWGPNALNLQDFGWGDGVDHMGAVGRHQVVLAPLAAPGHDAVSVTDPITGDRYTISYRSPSGNRSSDQYLSPGERGVYLHRLPRTGENHVATVLLPWILGVGRAAGGQPGFAFISPSGAVSVRVLAISARQASVEVRIDPNGGIVDDIGPAFGIESPSLSVGPRSAKVRIPRAWDPSGVVRYEVGVGGRILAKVTPAAHLSAQSVSIRAQHLRSGRTWVRVIDGRGNVSEVHLP